MFGKKTKNQLHNQIDTLIGTNTHITGNLNFSGGLRVDGKISGNVMTKGNDQSTLVLSNQGTIEGEIHVTNVIINGTVTGPIHADEYIELQENAKVFGDVYYGSMEIQLGASVEGKLIHQDKSKPEKLVKLMPAASE